MAHYVSLHVKWHLTVAGREASHRRDRGCLVDLNILRRYLWFWERLWEWITQLIEDMKPLFTLGETGCHTDKANLTDLPEVTALIHTRHHHGSLSVELTGMIWEVGGDKWCMYEGQICCCLRLKYLRHSMNMLFRNMDERTNRENIYKPWK